METRQYYLVDVDTGSLRFTPKGRRELQRLFHFAGVDVDRVRSQKAYSEALLAVRRAVQGMTAQQFARPRDGRARLAALPTGGRDPAPVGPP